MALNPRELLSVLAEHGPEKFPFFEKVEEDESEEGGGWKLKVSLTGFKEGSPTPVNIYGPLEPEEDDDNFVIYELEEAHEYEMTPVLPLSILESNCDLMPAKTYFNDGKVAHQVRIPFNAHQTGFLSHPEIPIWCLFWLWHKMGGFRVAFFSKRQSLPREIREQIIVQLMGKRDALNKGFDLKTDEYAAVELERLKEILDSMAPFRALGSFEQETAGDSTKIIAPVVDLEGEAGWKIFVHPSEEWPFVLRVVLINLVPENLIPNYDPNFFLRIASNRFAGPYVGASWLGKDTVAAHFDMIMPPASPSEPDVGILEKVIHGQVSSAYATDLILFRDQAEKIEESMGIPWEPLFKERLRKYKILLGEIDEEEETSSEG